MDDKTSPSSPPPHPELSYTTIPLNTPATEIRLLELFPSAEFSSSLHCRLYNTPISSPVPFKALSYAWGSDDKTHLIYVDSSNTSGNGNDADASVINVSSGESDNGEEADPDPDDGTTPTSTTTKNGSTRSIIRITSSLDCCLRHLRAIHHRDHLPHLQPPPNPNPNPHVHKPLTLWIDQLCIDQSDSDEKAVQVGLMSQIYSRAKQVLIWLGPEADGSDEVMDSLAELGREFESVGMSLGDMELDRMYDVMMGLLYRGDGEGGGAGVREGTGTTFGDDKVVDVPGDGNSVEVGSDLGVGVGVADEEALDGVAVACTTNKADASTGKTVIAVVEDGAARLVRLCVSGELRAFFRRPWFTRVWVVQEACLCADTVFVCGTKPPVSYDICGAIAICVVPSLGEFGRKGGYTPESDFVSTVSTDVEIAGVGMPIAVARDLGILAGQAFHSWSGRRSRLRQIMEGEGGENLFTLLVDIHTYLFREAKLHRDRVYALLGVAADADELEIKPDYSSQTRTAQILTEVAKAIIGKTKDGFQVELLSYSRFPKTIFDDGSDKQLPSWVPDWSSGLQSPFYGTFYVTDEDDANLEEENTGTDADMFMACGPHRSVDMVPTITAEMLGLRGYLVDTIEEVGGMAYQESFSTKPHLYKTIEFFEKLDRLWELSKQKNEPIYQTEARRAEALWRVPVGDLECDWEHIVCDWEHIDEAGGQHRAKPDFALEYHKWRRTLEQYQALDMDLTVPGWWADCVDEDKKKKVTEWGIHTFGADGGKNYHESITNMWRARKDLYLTKKGYMGMGPSDMQPGDVVVVFPGARIPFVLRPTNKKATFTYLGDAYCDGIMDGEITLRKKKRVFLLV